MRWPPAFHNLQVPGYPRVFLIPPGRGPGQVYLRIRLRLLMHRTIDALIHEVDHGLCIRNYPRVREDPKYAQSVDSEAVQLIIYESLVAGVPPPTPFYLSSHCQHASLSLSFYLFPSGKSYGLMVHTFIPCFTRRGCNRRLALRNTLLGRQTTDV